jgi:predicted nucleotidyltransferase
MPVRSLNSRVLRWPNADVVIGAARNWATALGRARKDVIRIGYIGSYARGDWGVGSDLDLVIVTDEANAPFHERALQFDALHLPVPVEMLVYTASEWELLMSKTGRYSTMLKNEARWLYERAGR